MKSAGFVLRLTTGMAEKSALHEISEVRSLYKTNGAGDEARTRYLHLGKVALYQMNYARKNSKRKKHYNKNIINCQYPMI